MPIWAFMSILQISHSSITEKTLVYQLFTPPPLPTPSSPLPATSPPLPATSPPHPGTLVVLNPALISCFRSVLLLIQFSNPISEIHCSDFTGLIITIDAWISNCCCNSHRNSARMYLPCFIPSQSPSIIPFRFLIYRVVVFPNRTSF